MRRKALENAQKGNGSSGSSSGSPWSVPLPAKVAGGALLFWGLKKLLGGR